MAMLHHISLGVSDIEKSGAFYDAIMATLGYKRVFTDYRPGEPKQAIGYGLVEGKDIFTIKERAMSRLSAGRGFHLAFQANSQDAVAEFHRVALSLGAVDRGGPRIFTEFGDDYFAAFVIDPDGWQLAAVPRSEANQ
jgi:catechol 2,3-dioxygenase-like lactoylglutathione lyase family enzyme